MLEIMDTYNHDDQHHHQYGKNENYPQMSMMINHMPKKVNNTKYDWTKKGRSGRPLSNVLNDIDLNSSANMRKEIGNYMK